MYSVVHQSHAPFRFALLGFLVRLAGAHLHLGESLVGKDAYGYRAGWKLLDTYWKHFKNLRQPYTVSNIIHRWAPPTENDTEAYAKTVIRLTSLGGMENLPRPFVGISIDKLVRLLRAMTTVECGIPYEQVSEAEIWEGYRLAFPGKLKQCKPKEEYLADEDKLSYPAYDEYWDWSASAG